MQWDLNDYGVIKLINYLRTLEGDVHKGLQFCEEVKEKGKQTWDDDRFLIPYDPNDPLLFLDWSQFLERK